MEFLRRLYEQIKGVWARLTFSQKATLVGVIAAVAVSLGVLVHFTTRPQYVALYTRIAPEEAGKIIAKLQDWRIPYKVKDTTIYVPVKQRDMLRIQLATEKLAPTGGLVTFEIFEKLRLTATDYERRIHFMRALQGELTRTIESLEQVESARVLIVLPKHRLYTAEQNPPTASIRVTLKPYATLAPHQVKGIMYLVAAAVEGMNPEDVTVVDNRGNILSEGVLEGGGASSRVVATQLEVQREEARILERKIKQKLSKVVGPDAVEVIVKYEMSFDRVERRAEKYSIPGFEQLKVSEEVQEEKFTGEAQVPGGPPGVEANIPGYKAVVRAKGPISYDRKERRTNYLADKEQILQIKAPYPTRISVAVFVDGTYERDEEGRIIFKEGKPIYHPRTPEEMRKYEELVWAAIGSQKGKVYKDREYFVTVQNVQFDRTQEWLWEKRERAAALQRMIMTAAIGGLIFLLIAIFGFIHLKATIRRRREEEERRRRELEREAALRELERRELELPPEERERRELEQRVIKIATEKPEVVADLIRTWMAEEE